MYHSKTQTTKKYFTQNHSGKYYSKPCQRAKHYCCCLHRGCASFRPLASPQLGSYRLSSWVKAAVVPAGLTQYKQGIGRAIERVGRHWVFCYFHAFIISLQVTLLPLCSSSQMPLQTIDYLSSTIHDTT